MPAYGTRGQYGTVGSTTELHGTDPLSCKNRGEKERLVGVDEEAVADSLFGPGARRTDNNRTMTVILMLNYMIGSGILNTPQTFRDSGLAATTMLYFIACIAIWIGIIVLIRAAEAIPLGMTILSKDACSGTIGVLEDLEFAALARRTLGERGDLVVDASIVVMNFGAVSSYVVLVGSLTTSLLREWVEVDSDSAMVPLWQSFYFVTPLMVLLLVFPPCLIRHLSNLRWLSAFSLLAIVSVICLVVIGGPEYSAAERAMPVHDVRLDAPLLIWNWTGAFAKLGSCVFALMCSAAAFHAYSSMARRTEREWMVTMSWAVVLGGLFCYGTGMVGYLSFREATEGDILDNFTGVVASGFKVMVVMHLVLYIPNEVVVLRHSFFALTGRNVMEENFCSVAAVTSGILMLILGVVMTLMMAGIAQGELFGYILDLTGGITGSLTSFILPALIYLKVTEGNENAKDVLPYRRACRVLVVFGFAVIILVPVAVFLNVLRVR